MSKIDKLEKNKVMLQPLMYFYTDVFMLCKMWISL